MKPKTLIIFLLLLSISPIVVAIINYCVGLMVWPGVLTSIFLSGFYYDSALNLAKAITEKQDG